MPADRLVLLALLALSAPCSMAQESPATPPTIAKAQAPEPPATITIVRKPGREDGLAQMNVNGKIQKITPGAVRAWTVRAGQAALILVVNKSKHATLHYYLLRYYNLDDGRRRTLGSVPLDDGQITESADANDDWAFALAGKSLITGKPVLFVGSAQSVPGEIAGASAPSFNGANVTFTAESGDRQTLKTATLVGAGLDHIYSLAPSSVPSVQYLQVFPNGTATTFSKAGLIDSGGWHTDGIAVHVETKRLNLNEPLTSLIPVPGIPAGTRFSVRLLQPLSSRTAKGGGTVEAVTITPIVIDGRILIPQGSKVQGTLTKANGVGWGFKHETASLTIDWNRITLPAEGSPTAEAGRTLNVDASTLQVENAQEKVTAEGRIKGIRSTGTPGHSAENAVLTFAGIDPIAYIFASASGSGVLGFAEPEILYDAGTELLLEYTRPVITDHAYPVAIVPAAQTTEARQQLQNFAQTLPFRTRTKGSNKVSDFTNLIFIGNAEALRRAFTAAGWLPTDDLNSTSTFRTLKTLSGNQTYTQAPMSVLLLDERAPLFTLSKTTNTFSSRHHVRIFLTNAKLEGVTTMTASSTQDIGIAFSRKQRSFIHVIDQHLDNERSKIVNDLTFTGCVDSVDMIPRPWLPTEAFNATGDRLLTDRDVAILRLNACDSPHTTPTKAALPPNRFERITRDTALSIRNDFYRGNFIYQGIAGGFAVHSYLAHSNDLPEDSGAWRKTASSGLTYAPLRVNKTASTSPELQRRSGAPVETSPEDLAAMARTKAQHKWDPPRYEFALEGGYLRFRSTDLSYIDIFLTSQVNPLVYELDLEDRVGSGWTAGGTVTVNTWKHFSNEFSYFRQQGKYTLNVGTFTTDSSLPFNDDQIDDNQLDPYRVGLTTRQFEYNLLAHLRPPTSRWRPYIAAGPVFQLIALSDAPLQKPAGVFTLGLKNIGLLKAAFDFGKTSPLDGGGIFQFGLQYGGGVKYRVTPHMMLRADYRETWSANPNIIKSSYEDYEDEIGDASYVSDVFIQKPAAKFFQDRFTLGIGFAF